MSTDFIAKQIEALEAELCSNPAYLKLQILREAKERLDAVDAGNSVPSAKTDAAHNATHPHVVARISVLAAVHKALEAAGRPLTTVELLEAIPLYGAESGGTDPKRNLVSQLSGKKTPLSRALESLKWNDRYVWWFADKPIPDGNTAGSDEVTPP